MSSQHDHQRTSPRETAEHGPHHPDVRFERTDVSFWGLAALAAGLCVFGLVIFAVVWWLYAAVMDLPAWRPLFPAYSDTAPETFPADPRLEGLERVEELGWPEQHDLDPPQEFGWIDREAGTVRIPADLAIDLFLRQQAKKTKDSNHETDN